MTSQDTSTHRKAHKHGRSRTTEYYIWRGMIRRCYYTPGESYQYYGARGVTVCDAWKEDFRNFFADMGERPSREYTLDRIDTYGPYSKDNCRWATRKEQANNTRANSIITFNGETLNVSQWAERIGIRVQTLRGRLRRGWSLDRALSHHADMAPRKQREFQLRLPSYCWCGNQAAARGLCQTHYASGRDRGTLLVGDGRACVCGKPHYAKGLCRKCYAHKWWIATHHAGA